MKQQSFAPQNTGRDIELPDRETKTATADHNQQQESSFLLQPPEIGLPKGGGAIKSIDEKFSVNAVNGTAGFSLPLPFSAARNFSAELTLSYNSGTGNGCFGMGWSTSLSSIKRKTEQQLPQYQDGDTDSDTYIIAGAEDLVPEFKKDADGIFITGTDGRFVPYNEPLTFSGIHYQVKRYRPRIEGLFSRIERWTDTATGSIHWRVISKNNTTAVYGKNKAACIADPADEKKIFEWLLDYTYDDKGNCAQYEYKQEDGAGIDSRQLHNRNRTNGNAAFSNAYLKRVQHGNIVPFTDIAGPLPTQFMFETIFDYGEHDTTVPFNAVKDWHFRPDAFSQYTAGFEIRNCRLCKKVLLYHHFNELPGGSALVKAMDFTYANNGAEGFTFLTAITFTGYTKHDDGTYTQQSFAPYTFNYQPHEWNETVQTISPEDLAHAPYGIDGSKYQFTDLYSEGLSGILTEQGNAWFYKANLGNGHFAAAQWVMPRPSFSGLGSALQLTELAADGVKQVTNWQTEPKGYFELSPEEEWQPFHAFESVPTINFNDPNVRLLDLDGDGLADVLITEQEVFTWYPSQGKKGFGAAKRTVKPVDEEKGPAIVFSERTQSIFLADMTGDGLTDIVRIQNGDVSYWPQLGYGKFGARVAMDNAPYFDHPDQFNAAFIKLADLDGSGTTDVIYYGNNEFRIWLNQQGNSFTPQPKAIRYFPELTSQSGIAITDLLGNSIPCIVWNSPLPAHQQAPLRYIDLMNSRKPHLMTAYRNNTGKEVALHYTPSTQFYIADKLAGTPWVTKLPFPVHCISKVEVFDHIMKTRFASEYSYHHGYYDHHEKEFRGFGRVDQQDSEAIEHFIVQNNGGNTVTEQDLHQPPVLTKTWFHTGAFTDRRHILDQFRKDYNPHTIAGENLLPEPMLPATLTNDELRQALRACKGMLLRKEVYALDEDMEKNILPYVVEQHNCLLKLLQPAGQNKHAVLLAQESESITYQYERLVADPRIHHQLTFAVDDYGNITGKATVTYGRKLVDATVHAAQKETYITYEEASFTGAITETHDYRTPLPFEIKSYHLATNLALHNGYYVLPQLQTACESAAFRDYHEELTASGQKRLIEFVRHQYRGNNGTDLLPFKTMQSKGLLHQSFKAAFTQPMLSSIFGEKITLPVLQAMLTDTNKGGYISADNYYWLPSGTQQYDVARFFLPTRFTNPFGKTTLVEYDANYALFVRKTTDALLNETLVKKFNYRTLSPYLVQDANNNCAALRFNELGMVIRSFSIGKKGIDAGDEFDDTKTEIKNALDFPCVENTYHLTEWFDQCTAPGFDPANYKPRPNFVITATRDTHYHAEPLHQASWLQAYAYSDGGGKVVLTKIQAAPGAALQVNADGTVTPIADTAPAPRWIGNGRTILNNKGNAVKQYEPYFSTSPSFDDEKEVTQLGVTSLIQYDPLSRVIRTNLPDKTFTKVEFSPWLQVSWDANDTVQSSDWYTLAGSPDPGGAMPANPQQRAAWLSARHQATPSEAHLDALGRTFLTIADKGTRYLLPTEIPGDHKLTIRKKFDIEGNEITVTDARERTAIEYAYNMAGSKIKQVTIDGGARWMIGNVAGQPLVSWDSRGHEFYFAYDDLQRATSSTVKTGGGAAIVYSLTEYGEGAAGDTDNNLRGNVHKQYDQAGVVINKAFDFKKNLRQMSRQLTQRYDAVIDWTTPATIVLETALYESGTEYDAMNRPLTVTLPHLPASAAIDRNEIYLSYSEAGILNKVDVKKRGVAGKTTFVSNITYNARGQREEIFYGNNTKTKYTYDTATFRLIGLLTTRNNGNLLQQLTYWHDATGNITQVQDAAHEAVFFDGENVQPVNQYEYDALYRLVKATGRKHAGQTDIAHTNNDHNYRNQPFIPSGTINPNDAAAFRNYTEEYTYDKAGNMVEQQHVARNSGWTRSFVYQAGTNRLAQTSVGLFSFKYIDAVNGIDYDPHGNMTVMEHLQQLNWNFTDQFTAADLGGGGHAYYVYDAQGQRVRKVIERPDGKKLERIYLNGIEIYREYNSTGMLTLERETLQVMDDKKRIAMVDTPVVKPAGNTETQLTRYQYDNHLRSASLELDDAAQLISYEEYFPFGTTAYATVDATREVPAKRYRYTGKERDEESGFSYHGARYYAPWLCRWTATDKQRDSATTNRYLYVNNNPVNYFDDNGLFEEPVHGATTYRLALAAGFTERDAAQIALATAGMDHNPATRPGDTVGEMAANIFIGHTQRYHYPSQEDALERVENDIAGGARNLSQLGEHLHSLEDVGFKGAPGPHSRSEDKQLSQTAGFVAFSLAALGGGAVAGAAAAFKSSNLGWKIGGVIMAVLGGLLLAAAATFLVFGLLAANVGHPDYITERGNQSTFSSHRADQAFQDPVRNARELRRIYGTLKRAAAARYGHPVASDDAMAERAIAGVTQADTAASINDYFNERPVDSNGRSYGSYADWAYRQSECGTPVFNDITQWPRSSFDASLEPDNETNKFRYQAPRRPMVCAP